MIYVSSGDARKELGLDSGGAGGSKDMEESELEEGEACSYQNHEDCDASIDPDVALSYIVSSICVFLSFVSSICIFLSCCHVVIS